MSETPTFEPPDFIGPYRVVRIVGEGGMGVVYEADQTEPVRRRVAVKMMKLGMDTKEVIGRFEAERQALAVMEHPGIAQVLDAGANESGRPYFVMELVRGLRIDELCDQERLTTRQRVELFIQVCEAVQHAHQKGVIHRDLKPSNILVAERDGRLFPKVIDFGIAKATGQRITEDTVLTTFGQALGTLAYMSPEQAGASGLDVDTRTDVYALGVVLYQLLAGRVPLEPGAGGVPAFLAQLLVYDTPPPSLKERVVGSSDEEASELAEARGMSFAGLLKALSGDLQWIVLKAIEKDRNLRYETTDALAMDLRRYLADEPVLARAPTTRYRIRKFVRRHRVGVAFSMLVVLLLTAFGATMSVQAARIAMQRDRAERAAANALAVNDVMDAIVLGADPLDALGPDITLLDAVDGVVASPGELYSPDPEVDAAVRYALGRVYLKVGRYEDAEELLGASLETRLSVLGEDEDDLAESLIQMGRVRWQFRSDLDSAEVLIGRALDIRLRVLEEGDTRTAEALRDLGSLHKLQGRFDEAANRLSQALYVYRVDLADSLDMSDVLSELGRLHDTRGELVIAERYHREALAIRENRLESDHPLVATSLNNLAVVLDNQGKLEEAADIYPRAISAMESALGPDHPNVAGLLGNYGHVLEKTGGLDEAENAFRRSLAIDSAAMGAGHHYVGIDRYNLGRFLCGGRDTEEGLANLELALAIFESALGPDHWRVGLGEAGYGECLGSLGIFGAAEAHLMEGLARLEAALADDHRHVVSARDWLAGVREKRRPGG